MTPYRSSPHDLCALCLRKPEGRSALCYFCAAELIEATRRSLFHALRRHDRKRARARRMLWRRYGLLRQYAPCGCLAPCEHLRWRIRIGH